MKEEIGRGTHPTDHVVNFSIPGLSLRTAMCNNKKVLSEYFSDLQKREGTANYFSIEIIFCQLLEFCLIVGVENCI